MVGLPVFGIGHGVVVDEGTVCFGSDDVAEEHGDGAVAPAGLDGSAG